MLADGAANMHGLHIIMQLTSVEINNDNGVTLCPW